MKIKVVTVGKLKEKYLKDGIAEYSKRISRFAKLEMIELADEKTPDRASESENQKILEIEGQRILSKVGDRDFVIALAIEALAATTKVGIIAGIMCFFRIEIVFTPLNLLYTT